MSVEPKIPPDAYDPMLNMVLVFLLAVLLLLFAYGKLVRKNKKALSDAELSDSEKTLDYGELEKLEKEGNDEEFAETQEISEVREIGDLVNPEETESDEKKRS